MIDVMQRWTAAMRADAYDAAWELSDRVLRATDPATRDDPAKPYHLRWVWDGTDVDGRDVLVRCYHGLGDTIQFARFLPVLAHRAASVTLEVQPELLALVGSMEGVDRAVPFDPERPLPPSECDLEITELAFALRTSPLGVPPPYLHATPAEIPSGAIAICHSASSFDTERSVPADLFAAICNRHRCVALVPGACALPVLNPAGCSLDIMNSASLLAAASLVITVDTMVAHLAGALGRPTWLLLKAEPDWRWCPSRSDSSWYPATRQYVQPCAGDWASVIAAVDRDLAAWSPPFSADVR